MTIRTANPMSSAQMLLDLQRSKDRYANYSTQITTGSRIVNVGDDPSGSALLLNFQASIDQNDQYVGQLATATSYLQNTQTVADTVGTDVTRLMELAQQGLTGTQSSTSLTAISNEVDGIYKNIVNLANTQVQGKYIFGGSNTTTKPFDDTTVPAGQPNSITYNGNNSTISLNVGASATTATNMPGDTLFLGGAAPASYGSTLDIFNATKSLSLALQAGNTAGIQTAYDNLKSISDHVNQSITEMGGWQSSIDELSSNITALTSNLQAVQDSVGAVDYPTAITGLNKENVAQQASLSVMAKMNKYNLLDYLA